LDKSNPRARYIGHGKVDADDGFGCKTNYRSAAGVFDRLYLLHMQGKLDGGASRSNSAGQSGSSSTISISSIEEPKPHGNDSVEAFRTGRRNNAKHYSSPRSAGIASRTTEIP